MNTLLFILAAFSGEISQESIRESESQDWVHHRTRVDLRLKSEDEVIGQSSWLRGYEASGYFQYDAALDWDERVLLRPDNILLRVYHEQWSARVGWQTIHWGETLGPSLIDVINPRDLSDPSYWLRGDQKLAIPLALVGWSRDSLMVDAWISPFAPRAYLPDEWQTLPVENNDRMTTPEFGIRAGNRLAGWDFKAYALRHRSRTPSLLLEVQGTEPEIQADFPLQTTLGFTLSQAWDNIVLRSEYAHGETLEWPDASILNFARDQVVVGLDGTWGDHFFWATELRYQDAGWVIAQGRWTLWNDRIKPLIYLMQRIQNYDSYQRYEVTADIYPAWEAGLYWEAFQSGNQGYFSKLQAADRLGLTLRWEF